VAPRVETSRKCVARNWLSGPGEAAPGVSPDPPRESSGRRRGQSGRGQVLPPIATSRRWAGWGCGRPVDWPRGLRYRHAAMPTPRSRSLATWRRHAVRRMAATRRSTLAFLARLPEGEILRSHTQSRWSIKDVFAHLLSCDEETIRRFRLIERGQGDRIHWFESVADIDRFNAQTVARLRRLGLRPLLRRMEDAHAALVHRFGRLPTESLRDPSHAYPVLEWLPAPGWRHEQEHVSEIRAWWRGRRTARANRRSDPRPAGRSKRR
jgi:DinB family protein